MSSEVIYFLLSLSCEQSLDFDNNPVVSTQPLYLMLGWGLDGGWFREYVLDMT